MSIWVIFSGIITPAIFWLGYFYYKDRFQPEPFREIGISYILGIVSAFSSIQFFRLLPLVNVPEDPSALMESSRLEFLFYSLGVTGLIEELFKFLPFILVVVRFRTFDEKTDGIIYASAIALGFASYENARYLAHMEGLELMGRAFASPLTHTIFASTWGYLYASAKMKGKSLFKYCFIGLMLAAAAHGLFNFLTTSATLRVAGALMILGIWIWRIRILERARP